MSMGNRLNRMRSGWRMTLRGYKLLAQLDRGFIPFTLLQSLVTAAGPLIALRLSALILNELSGARDPAALASYVAMAIGSSFLIAILQALMTRQLNASMQHALAMTYWITARQYSSMDYSYTEDPQITGLLDRIALYAKTRGGGVYLLFELLGGIAQSAFSCIISAVLLAGLFILPASSQGWLMGGGGTALFLLMIILIVAGALSVSNRIDNRFLRQIENRPDPGYYRDYYEAYMQPGQAGKDIRIYRQANAILDMLRVNLFFSRMRGHRRLHYLGKGLEEAAQASITGLVYLFVGLRALGGACPAGSVIQYAGALNQLLNGLTRGAAQLRELWENSQYLTPLFTLLDLPNPKYQGALTTEKRDDNDYVFAFHHVSFRYPGASEYALKDVSLELHCGRRLAVVGPNGSGKTTLIKLLCRLYDPSEGTITLNGIDIRKYRYDQYMDLFSVVFQDFSLFSLPLGENVAAGRPYDEARIRETLARVGFGPRLASLPQQLDTMLYKSYDPQGIEPSGGEAQLIALARALYKGAPFLVLDEPTAALDPVAEYEIYTRLQDITGQRSAIFISHRLASCRFCDEIAVFDQGRLVEYGTHEALLSRCGGKYAELWQAQAQYYRETDASGRSPVSEPQAPPAPV